MDGWMDGWTDRQVIFNFTYLYLSDVFNLDDAENLQAEYKKQPCHLERLYGILYKTIPVLNILVSF